MDAYSEIILKIKKNNDKIINIQNKIDIINGTINILARKSDLSIEATRLRSDISNISSTVTDLNDKLAKVYLPADTKYYLDEDELKDLRNKIRQINALMIRLQELEKTIVKTLNQTLIDND